MIAKMETDDFEAAAEFISGFGSFAAKYPKARVEISETEPGFSSEQEVGASQPAVMGVPMEAESYASIDSDVMLLPIDTPAFDISMDPGRFAFEEEG